MDTVLSVYILCTVDIIAQYTIYMCVLVAQSCLTFCDSMECSPLGYSVHGILQAKILEWAAIPFSRGSSGPRDGTQVSSTAGVILHCLSHQET